MTRNVVQSILTTSIASLDFSNEFKAMAEQNGYTSLQEILQTPLTEFPGLPGSGYRLFRELLDFLNAHDLGDLVDD